MARKGLPPSRPRAADHARAVRTRARASDHRQHQTHPRTRDRAHRARRKLRTAAARRAWLRTTNGGQAHWRDRRRRPVRHRLKTGAHGRPRRSPPPRATPTATASTAAGTASSTARSIAWPSTREPGIPMPPRTSPANKLRASRAKKRSAASNATSPAASGSSYDPPRR